MRFSSPTQGEMILLVVVEGKESGKGQTSGALGVPR